MRAGHSQGSASPAAVEDCLKLTTYLGERDRTAGGFLADALLDLYAREGVLASVALRGVEGFGARHALHTGRLLTLSEDLPYVTIAVDTRDRIQRLLPEVRQLCDTGLVTIERARMIRRDFHRVEVDNERDGALKLTVLVGRIERIGAQLAYHAVVELLHENGIPGATAFLGVDGTAHGSRERARFFGRNERVPVAIVAVGGAPAITATLPSLGALLERPLILLERARVCKLAGERLASPDEEPGSDPSGLPMWQKLMIHAPERAQRHGLPLYATVVRSLRRAGAPGATALRGVWGYQDGQRPHGDGLLSPGRRVPVVVTVIDTPERAGRWFALIDELTVESGLVTSELVPAAAGTGSRAILRPER